MILYNESRNLALLTIAKNCSTSLQYGISKGFVQFDEKIENIELAKNTDAIIIFRDPINRWISGTVEYFAYPEGPPWKPMSDKGIELNFQQWLASKPQPWDYHTELQSTYYDYQGLNLKPYWYNKDVLKQINEDYNCLDNILQEHAEHQEPFRKKYKEMVLSFIEKNKDKVMAHLNELYQNDYNFFQTLKFVNR